MECIKLLVDLAENLDAIAFEYRVERDYYMSEFFRLRKEYLETHLRFNFQRVLNVPLR